MWLFSRKRFLALEERQEKLERDLRATVLEAENLYEKARTALGRLAKRGQVSTDEPPPPSNGSVPAHLRHLDPVSQRIMMQRAQRFSRPNGDGE